MELYYITSVLNIDNILSSESLSPISFYKTRGFGSNYYEEIPNIKMPKNKIVLFDYLPYINIEEVERINYPVVLKICDIDEKRVLRAEKIDGVYLFDNTLYINPINCEVLFFSIEAYKEAELRCSDSKTNKLYKFFHKSLVSKNKSKDISAIDFSGLESSSKDIICHIQKDQRLNSQKGSEFGWYCGSGLSIDSDLAKLKSIESKTYNYVSAIRNNNGKMTQAYYDKLNELDKEYKLYDPNIKEAKNLWDCSLASFCSNKEAFDKFLKELRVEAEVKKAFLKRKNIVHRENISVDSIDAYMNEMHRYTETLITLNRPSYDFYNDKVNCSDNEVDLYGFLLEKLFFSKKFSFDELRIKRSETAYRFIESIKNFIEQIGKKWENSEEFVYLQSLMLNICQSEHFDFNGIENNVLKSIAAFLLKGEDFDEMMAYLQNNAMSNFRFALGFWCTACGYADMPKKITKTLFESDDIKKITEVYKRIYNIVFDSQLEGDFAVAIPIHQPTEAVQGSIPVELKAVFESKDFKTMTKPAQEYYKNNAIRLLDNYSVTNPSYIEALKKLDYTKNKKSKDYWQNAIKVQQPNNLASFKAEEMFPIG